MRGIKRGIENAAYKRLTIVMILGLLYAESYILTSMLYA